MEYPDNSSIAVIFYCGGCDRNCQGCHNTDLQKFIKFDHKKIIQEIKNYCKRVKTNKIVLCGGDPLFHRNLSLTKEILWNLKSDYDICIYTGATIKEVKDLRVKGFKYIKCGVFDLTKFVGAAKTDEYMQFATTNQELYDENLNLLSKDGKYYFKED